MSLHSTSKNKVNTVFCEVKTKKSRRRLQMSSFNWKPWGLYRPSVVVVGVENLTGRKGYYKCRCLIEKLGAHTFRSCCGCRSDPGNPPEFAGWTPSHPGHRSGTLNTQIFIWYNSFSQGQPSQKDPERTTNKKPVISELGSNCVKASLVSWTKMKKIDAWRNVGNLHINKKNDPFSGRHHKNMSWIPDISHLPPPVSCLGSRQVVIKQQSRRQGTRWQK